MSAGARRRPGGNRPPGKKIERGFAAAMAHHRGGRTGEAEAGYRKVIAADPAHPGARYYLALLLKDGGRTAEALEHMAEAVEAAPSDAALRNNFGNLLREAGQTGAAAEAYRAAVERDPEYVNAWYNLGTTLSDLGDYAGAEAALRQVVSLAAGDGDAWNALGTLTAAKGSPEEALECFERALKLRPGDARAAFNRGACLKDLARLDEAADAYRHALGLDPAQAAGHYQLALVERRRGNPGAAESALREALRARPDHAPARGALIALLKDAGRLEAEAERVAQALAGDADDLAARQYFGEVLMELDRWEAAAAQFERVCERRPGDAAAQNGLSRAYISLRRHQDAVQVARKAIESAPELADAHSNLGLALRYQGRLKEAIEAFETAIRLDPGFAAAWNNLGLACMDDGDIERARECYRKALERDSNSTSAYMNLSRSRKFTQSDRAEVEQVESMLTRPELDSESRASLHFALGKMYEDLERYDDAFEHYRRGNDLKKQRFRFNGENYSRWVEKFLDACTPPLFRHKAGWGDDSERPVFIVGMPRSGTTLVEQILSSHPRVFGADELPFISELAEALPGRLGSDRPYPLCLESLDADSARRAAEDYLAHIGALAGDETRVTDKMPTNFFHLGLIALLFPNARVIHCRRDAMDVALSNYVQYFAEGHYYSYDLQGIAVYYRGYERLMAHWREVLPLPLHEAGYEALVEDPEKESRRLIDFLGLPWDDRCLEFHKTRRSVRTASNWQVRQPIYKSSTRRWRRFAPYLEDLMRALDYDDTGQ